MTDYGDELPSDWEYWLGPRRETPPRYVPAPIETVSGDTITLCFDGDQVHVSRASNGAAVDYIKLPAGLRLCREVR